MATEQQEQAASREEQAKRSQQEQPTHPLGKEPTRHGLPIPERNPVWEGQAYPPGEDPPGDIDLGDQAWHERAAEKAHEINDYMQDKRQSGHVVVDADGNVGYERSEPSEGENVPHDFESTPAGMDPGLPAQEQHTDTQGSAEQVNQADYPAEGTKDEVLAWVKDDPDRAAVALRRERSGRQRSTLVSELEAVITKDRLP
jgi:hypothetical protein